MAADIAAAGRAAIGPLALPDIISLAALMLSADFIAPAIKGVVRRSEIFIQDIALAMTCTRLTAARRQDGVHRATAFP